MMMSFIVGGVVGYPNAIDKDYAMTFRYQAACNTMILITEDLGIYQRLVENRT